MLTGAAVPALPGRGTARGAAAERCAAIAVLDRTKEPGSLGEPLYLDVVAALTDAAAGGERAAMPRVMRRPLRPVLEGVHAGDGRRRLRRAGASHSRGNRFTVGIDDDVSGTEPAATTRRSTSSRPDTIRAVFDGLGADGTVGANKNSVKIIARGRRPARAGLFRL